MPNILKLITWLGVSLLGLYGIFIATPSTPALYLSSEYRKAGVSRNQSFGAMPLFKEETMRRGIFRGHSQRGKRINNISESMGAGICVFDYNNDNWIDILLLNGKGQQYYSGQREWWQQGGGLSLYKNVGGGYFEDVTEESGLSSYSSHMGCMAADLDSDGDKDVLITNFGSNELFENQGSGKFTKLVDFNDGGEDKWSTSAIAVDLNGDNLLDIYVANYIDFSVKHRTLEVGSGFDLYRSTWFDPSKYDAQSNQILINQGDLKFKRLEDNNLIVNKSGRSLSVKSARFNEDDLPDLLIVNDIESPNKLFINNSNLEFNDSSNAAQIATTQQTRDVALVVGHTDDYTKRLVLSTGPGNGLVAYEHKPQSPNNILVDISGRSKLETISNVGNSGFGIVSADINSDGISDLFVANGYLTPNTRAPSYTQAQKNQLWFGVEDGTYLACDDCLDNLDIKSSRGVGVADFDNDGDVDLFVTSNNDLGALLINQSNPESWFGLRIDDQNGISGEFALIAETNDSRTNILLASDQQSFLSTGENRIIFYPKKDAHDPFPKLKVKNSSDAEPLPIELKVNGYSAVSVVSDSVISVAPLESSESLSLFIEDPVVRSIQSTYPNEGDQVLIAMWLMQRSKERWSKQLLEKLLVSKDPEIRSSIAPILSYSKQQAEIVKLIELTEDPSSKVRAAAIRALIKIEYEALYPIFTKMLMDESEIVVCVTAESMSAIFEKEEAMPRSKLHFASALLKKLDSKLELASEKCIITAIGYTEDYVAANALLHKYTESFLAEEISIQSAIIDALGRIRNRAAEGFLLNLLLYEQISPIIIAASAVALKRIGEPIATIERTLEKRIALLQVSEQEWARVRSEIVGNAAYTTVIPVHIVDSVLRTQSISKDNVAENQSASYHQDATAIIKFLTTYHSTCLRAAEENTLTIATEHIQELKQVVDQCLRSVDRANDGQGLVASLLRLNETAQMLVLERLVSSSRREDLTLVTNIVLNIDSFSNAVRLEAIELLAKHKKKIALQLCYKMLASDDDSVAVNAIRIIATEGGQDHLQRLAVTLKNATFSSSKRLKLFGELYKHYPNYVIDLITAG